MDGNRLTGNMDWLHSLLGVEGGTDCPTTGMPTPFLLDGGTNAEGKDIGTGSFSRAQYTKNMAWIDIFGQRHGPNISLLLCNLIVIELDKAVNVFYFLLSQLLFCSFTVFKMIVKLKSKDNRLFNFIKFIRLFNYITTVDCI